MTTMIDFVVAYEGGVLETIHEESLDDAIAEVHDRQQNGDWDASDGPIWVVTWLTWTDADGDECRESVTTRIDQPEPDCVDSDGHTWESPIELVGGIEENLGVFGAPSGGVVIHEACVRCGCGRTTHTRFQRSDTGAMVGRAETYEEDKYDLTELDDEDNNDSDSEEDCA